MLGTFHETSMTIWIVAPKNQRAILAVTAVSCSPNQLHDVQEDGGALFLSHGRLCQTHQTIFCKGITLRLPATGSIKVTSSKSPLNSALKASPQQIGFTLPATSMKVRSLGVRSLSRHQHSLVRSNTNATLGLKTQNMRGTRPFTRPSGAQPASHTIISGPTKNSSTQPKKKQNLTPAARFGPQTLDPYISTQQRTPTI